MVGILTLPMAKCTQLPNFWDLGSNWGFIENDGEPNFWEIGYLGSLIPRLLHVQLGRCWARTSVVIWSRDAVIHDCVTPARRILTATLLFYAFLAHVSLDIWHTVFLRIQQVREDWRCWKINCVHDNIIIKSSMLGMYTCTVLFSHPLLILKK